MSLDEYLYLPFPTDHETTIGTPRFFAADYHLLTCCAGRSLHRHNFYEVHWLSRGSARFTSDFQKYRLQQGVLTFVAPGQLHAWDETREYDSKLMVIAFEPTLLSLHGGDPNILLSLPFFDASAQPFVNAPPELCALFDRLFTTVLERYSEVTAEHARVLSSYVNVILTEANYLYAQQQQSDTTTQGNNLVRGFHMAVNAHFAERKQIQDYAELLGVTSNHLVEVVRKKTGKTPGQWQQERLLLEAKRLLAYTEDSVGEIGFHLSFKSASQFAKWFKHGAGNTPGEFRQTVLSESRSS